MEATLCECENVFLVILFEISGKDSERCFKLLRPIQLTDLKQRIIFQSANNNKGFIDEFRVCLIFYSDYFTQRRDQINLLFYEQAVGTILVGRLVK